MLLRDPHYRGRHWSFVWQSLQDMAETLSSFDASLVITQGDIPSVFNSLSNEYNIKTLFSHQEVGLAITYERDKQLARWCRDKDIQWQESPTGAVVRGASSRETWDKDWKARMRAPLLQPALSALQTVAATGLNAFSPPKSWLQQNSDMQRGGEREAHRGDAQFL